MTSPRLVGTHHHYLTNLVGPGTTPGEAIYGLVKYFTNNEGADLELGDVVKLDPSGDELVEKAETLGDAGVIGVVASAGPFADGEATPVLTSGYHASVKITGTVAAGDYLQASNTDGTAETIAPPGDGTFARATADGAGGFAPAIVFTPEFSTAAAPATQLLETGGPQILDIAAIADGEYLKRSGTDIVGDTPAGGGGSAYNVFDPLIAPNAADDEFNDDTNMSGPVNGLDGQWAWRNQGTSTITFPISGVARLAIPAQNATHNWRILEQAVAAGNFSFQVYCSAYSAQLDNAFLGMGVIDRTNGDFYSLTIDTFTSAVTQIALRSWTNVTTFAANLKLQNFGATAAWLRIDRTGTALTFYYSTDSIAWVRLHSLTDTLNVNGVMLTANEINNSGISAAYFRGFRRTL